MFHKQDLFIWRIILNTIYSFTNHAHFSVLVVLFQVSQTHAVTDIRHIIVGPTPPNKLMSTPNFVHARL